ncbi:MAG: pyridoxal-dependent decarboxylase [Alphaproteobacteria bacterium]|nr:pyridoxal-dependent decarboxylase [Alphaproteobacteria bacterium]
MTPEEFRTHAHKMVDWVADYMTGVESYPVRSRARPGESAAKLPAAPPIDGEPMAAIFDDFKRDVLPGMTHWQHPSFFAYFTANSSPPSVLAEMLTATLGAQCMLWQTSPMATEMETVVLDWLRQMTGLPDGLHGVIQDSASSAILCAILTARERATGWRGNEAGLRGLEKLTAYTSGETHTSTEKGIKIAGLGVENLRKLPVDSHFAVMPDALERMIVADIQAGFRPTIVVASLGATGVGAVDPLRAIGEICQRHGVFLHVDAAWAGSAWILPETRWMLEGIEFADSLVFNPHKWLFTNFDCAAHYVKDPEDLIRTLTILPEYLKSPEQGQVIDYRDWSVPLGRRFRALKLWFVIRSYGVSGLQEMVRRHIAWAADLESWIAADAEFELVAPRSLALVTFRYRPAGAVGEDALNRLNAALVARINDDGRIYLTQTLVGETYAIRFNIGQTWTERRHVEAGWAVVKDLAGRISDQETV